MTKAEQRKMLEAGVMSFVTGGGTISKAKPKKTRTPKAKEQHEIEIDVEALPAALRQKFFANV